MVNGTGDGGSGNSGTGNNPGKGAPGYQVDPNALLQASDAAKQVANLLSDMVSMVHDATNLPPAPKGLGVGQSLNDIRPLWMAHLESLSQEAQTVSDRLQSNAESYAKVEHAVTGSLHAIQS